jgi:hypothetical protein
MDEKLTKFQFCDEYEDLFQKCLQTLTQWTQLRGFDDQLGAAGTPAKSEARRAELNYLAAFSALRLHSRGCILCEERLRLHTNGSAGSAACRVS